MHKKELVFQGEDGKTLGVLKVKKTLKDYATDAVVTLDQQLDSCKSPKRKAKLMQRLAVWLSVLEDAKDKPEETIVDLKPIE